MKWHMHMWFFSYLHKSLTFLFSCSRPLNKKSKVSYFRVISVLYIISAFFNMLNQIGHLKALLKLKDGILETSVAFFSNSDHKRLEEQWRRVYSRDWSLLFFLFSILNYLHSTRHIHNTLSSLPYLLFSFPLFALLKSAQTL